MTGSGGKGGRASVATCAGAGGTGLDPVAVAAELARQARRNGGVDVRYVDDLGALVDDGQYVSLVLSANGAAGEVIVMTTENFYECLRKVMTAALPSLAARPLS